MSRLRGCDPFRLVNLVAPGRDDHRTGRTHAIAGAECPA